LNVNFADGIKVKVILPVHSFHAVILTRETKQALTSFFALGHQSAAQIMAQHYIHPTARMSSLSNQLLMDLTTQLTRMKIETEARKQIQDNIKRLRDMQSYRGRRHAMGLPVRGQTTRSQINTARRLNRIDRKA
jgi:small subunit ribosomal protein S13